MRLINSHKTVLYYHMYLVDDSFSLVDQHLAIIEKAEFDLVYIYAYNVNLGNEPYLTEISAKLSSITNVRMHVSNCSHVNEFATLEKVSADLCNYEDDVWIAYAHSKGVTHGTYSDAARKGILLLKQLILIQKTIKKNGLFADYFDVAGSDLVVANFNDFGPPQFAFAGNMWVAKISHLKRLAKIHANFKHLKSLRYQAEGWIGSYSSSNIFNIFSPARHHYDEHWLNVDESGISSEFSDFTKNNLNYEFIQEYFNNSIEYHKNKIEHLYKNFYPYSLKLRRGIFNFIKTVLISNKLFFRIVMSFLYRVGFLKSPLGLFYLDVPSQLTISKSIKYVDK
jgi:hypothetical protein